jgi:hypothetical protein
VPRSGPALWPQSKPERLTRRRRIEGDFEQRATVTITSAREARVDRRDDTTEARSVLRGALGASAPPKTQRFEEGTGPLTEAPELDDRQGAPDR